MKRFLRIASLPLLLIFSLSLIAVTSESRVPTEEEDLKMLTEASEKQQKQMREMIKQSQKMIEDYKKNPQKYHQATQSSKSANKNKDGIPVMDVSKTGEISPLGNQGAPRPQLSQEQLDQLMKSLEQTKKALERRNQIMEKSIK